MANGATHQLAGAVAGIAACATDNPDRATGVHHPLAAGAIGAALGKLPDLIEPAVHPHHRRTIPHEPAGTLASPHGLMAGP